MEGRERLREGLQVLRPQVERLARDEELHAHLQNAYASGRLIYERLFGGRGARGFARRVSRDTELRRELARTLEELRAAGSRVQPKPSQRGRNAAFFVSGLGLALLFNPLSGAATRRWLERRLLGSEGEASYPANGQPAQNEAALAAEATGAEAASGGLGAKAASERERGRRDGQTPEVAAARRRGRRRLGERWRRRTGRRFPALRADARAARHVAIAVG